MKRNLRQERTEERNRANARGWLLIGVIAAGLAGCGGASGPPLANVAGTVTRDGQPVADADVMFMPEHGVPSSGKTDSAGHFTLKFNDGRPGAVPGKHRVLITIPGTPLPPPTPDAVMPTDIKPPGEFRKEVEVPSAGASDLKIEIGA